MRLPGGNVYWVLGVVGLGIVAITFRPIVDGDGVGYYSYLQAVLVEHTLDLRHAYAAAEAAHVSLVLALLQVPGRPGYVADFFPVGPALLASPFYAAVLALSGGKAAPYSLGPLAAYTLTSLLAGLLAIALCWRLTRSAVAVAATVVCTPLLFYVLYQPGASHAFSAFAVSLFVWVWWQGRGRRTAPGWFVLGLLGGLMALIRFQDGLLLLIALLDWRGARWRLLLLVAGAAVAFAPQLAVDQVILGSWLPSRPSGQALGPPVHVLQVLFASNNGLFVTSPVAIVAVVGMFFIRDRTLRVAALFAFAIETLINGSAPDWWGGFAVGARRFVALTPFFALGFAAIQERIGSRVLWLLTVLGGLWTMILIADVSYVEPPRGFATYSVFLHDQLAAIPMAPRFLAAGATVRNLVLFPLLGRPADMLGGVLLLLGQAVCVALAVLALRSRRRREPAQVAGDTGVPRVRPAGTLGGEMRGGQAGPEPRS